MYALTVKAVPAGILSEACRACTALLTEADMVFVGTAMSVGRQGMHALLLGHFDRMEATSLDVGKLAISQASAISRHWLHKLHFSPEINTAQYTLYTGCNM